jgi:hypothetical protein
MAIVFVFNDEEDNRAKELGVNVMKLKDTTDESLTHMLNEPMVAIFMPFLQEPEEKKKLFDNFHNQIVMRKIWTGKE